MYLDNRVAISLFRLQAARVAAAVPVPAVRDFEAPPADPATRRRRQAGGAQGRGAAHLRGSPAAVAGAGAGSGFRGVGRAGVCVFVCVCTCVISIVRQRLVWG